MEKIIHLVKITFPYYGNKRISPYGTILIDNQYKRKFDLSKENKYIINGKKYKLEYEIIGIQKYIFKLERI